MKTIIAGSRNITDYYEVVQAIIDSKFEITEIISGLARGPDSLGLIYAKNNNLPIIKCKANWDKFGKSAGYRRNIEMASIADALIAVYDGKSKGTKHMINIAKDMDLKIYVHLVT